MATTEQQLLYLLAAVVILWLLYTLFSSKSGSNEGMCNASLAANRPLVYHPRNFQPDIANAAHDGGYIELNEDAETPWARNVGLKQSVYGEIDNPLEPVDMSLNYNLCSKNCCSPQWPLPFSMPPDEFLVKAGNKKYVPSPYTCNNAFQSSGCVCLEESQASFLSSRGLNG